MEFFAKHEQAAPGLGKSRDAVEVQVGCGGEGGCSKHLQYGSHMPRQELVQV